MQLLKHGVKQYKIVDITNKNNTREHEKKLLKNIREYSHMKHK